MQNALTCPASARSRLLTARSKHAIVACRTPSAREGHVTLTRRELIAALGGAAAAWPIAARAQQLRFYRVAVLVPIPASVFTAFFDELRQHGFVEGQHLAVDRRGFDARYDRFPAIAAELVKAGPDAIMCGGDAAIRAAQAATATIPIVASTDDMVGSG